MPVDSPNPHIFTQGFGEPDLAHVLTVLAAKHRTPGWKNLAVPGVLRPIELEGLQLTCQEDTPWLKGGKFPGL